MSKKYLVRRENLRFIGPMTRSEFREGLRRMDFGLQDEVAGHCGAWVLLDREDMVQRHYPELAAIVTEEMPAAWREMTGHAKKLTHNEQSVKSSRARKSGNHGSSSSSKSKHKNSQGKPKLILGVSVLLLSLAAGAYLWVKNQQEQPIPVGDIANLALQNDMAPFLNEMGFKLVAVTSRVQKNKEMLASWLPYLRMYAFHTNGSIEGVSQKILRGSAAPAAPLDCSVEAWKKRWTELLPQIGSLTTGKLVPKTQWVKTLMWDPYWIMRRTNKGWINPRNWYEGCLMSATVAIRAISSSGGSGGLNGGQSAEATGTSPSETIALVSRRLQIQLETLRSMKSTLPNDNVSFLGALSCMDLSLTFGDINRCKRKGFDPVSDSALDEYYNWSLIRLGFEGQSLQDKEFINELTLVVPRLTPESSFSKLDYSIELQIIKDGLAAGGKFEGYKDKFSPEALEVKGNGK
ncbi:MAG: hypothetical protein NT027_03990 [Proteobacteria bacterium]|nr:hypothetical protein [Pseudomonadota bacterium]